MKKVLILLGISFIISSYSKCDRDEVIITKPTRISIDETIFDQEPIFSLNQLVIRFTRSLTNQEKESLEQEFFVTKTEACSCGDESIQLWTIDTTKLNIETAIDNLKSKEEEEGVEGDRNFRFRMYSGQFPPSYGQFDPIVDRRLISDNDTDVNMAIVDTGIDTKFYTSSNHSPFLYNNRGNSNCQTGIPGWNFADDSEDIRDDNGHGSWVTRIITKGLDKRMVSYKILPIKAFNADGFGSYRNIVCAMNYIKTFPDINVVNASFGTYLPKVNTILLHNIMEELGTNYNILIICSAGNRGINTDIPGNEHSPSGYELDNILSVGGHDNHPQIGLELFDDNSVTGLISHQSSNYGVLGVDLASSMQNHGLIDKRENGLNDILWELTGTSFAAADVTSKCAPFYQNNRNATPQMIKNLFLESIFYANSLENKFKNGKVVLHDDFVANSRN